MTDLVRHQKMNQVLGIRSDLIIANLTARLFRKPLLYLSELRGHLDLTGFIWHLNASQFLHNLHAITLNCIELHRDPRGKDGETPLTNPISISTLKTT
jgi:hypothetical protein